MRYTELQNEIVKRYRIKLDPCSKCWGRIHAHIRERRVCKWHPKNSAESTFTLLHEIGHIENNHSGMRRAEAEYHATVWALERAREYGIEVSEKTIKAYQDYIDREWARGIRRGGKGYYDMTLEKSI